MSGNLFIVAAPSGAGKTSLVNALVEQDNAIRLSVSHTTRAARQGEREGIEYYFVDDATFADMRAQGAFLESATVFDHCYGTSAESVQALLKQGFDVILEIDWQGAQQVRRNIKNCQSIFILPPSRQTLEQRLRSRGKDDESIIQRRMRDAKNEMSHYVEFDYLVVNDDFNIALNNLQAIISAARNQIAVQQVKHQDLLADLLA